MKRLLLLTFTALAAIACNKSDFNTQNSTTQDTTAPQESIPVTITLKTPNLADTKLNFDQTADTWITKWSNGDKLTAYHYLGESADVTNNTQFTLSNVSADGKNATFNGNYLESNDGFVLMYAGSHSENKLQGKVGLSLKDQHIIIGEENISGALGEYSYMISEPIAVDAMQAGEYNYSAASVKHLTALMELTLQLNNLPDKFTYNVSSIEIASLHTEESYNITKPFNSNEFATYNAELGAYNLIIEGCKISKANNTFTIPFNAFPFTVKSGEYLDITVCLEQLDNSGNATAGSYIYITINNTTGADLEFGRGKHHTISYSYNCVSDDFPYIWDGKHFVNKDDAKTFLGEPAVDGTYYINSAVQMAAMVYLINMGVDDYCQGSYTLLNDINLNGKEWTPIGTIDNKFSGVFNGGEFTISGVNVHKDDYIYDGYNGLFGYTDEPTINNLTVTSYN